MACHVGRSKTMQQIIVEGSTQTRAGPRDVLAPSVNLVPTPLIALHITSRWRPYGIHVDNHVIDFGASGHLT